MLLLKRFTRSVDTGVAEHSKRAGAICDSVPIGERPRRAERVARRAFCKMMVSPIRRGVNKL